MHLLSLGILFICAELVISLGSREISLLPDAVGYFLLIRGLDQVRPRNRMLGRARLLALVMGLLTAVLYVAGWFADSAQNGFILWLLELAATGMGLVVSYLVLRGVERVSRKLRREFQGERLKVLWIAMAAVCVIRQLISWMPLVGDVAQTGSLLLGICYAAVFWNAVKFIKK